MSDPNEPGPAPGEEPTGTDAADGDPRLAALRARLRDEPVDVDPSRRERAIAAALDAAETPGHAVHDEVGARRGRATMLRPALVAAATVVVVALGAFGLGGLDGGGSDEQQAAVADRAEVDAGDDGATAEERDAGAPEAAQRQRAADEAEGRSELRAPATTGGPVEPATPSTPPDVGRAATLDELLARVEARTDGWDAGHGATQGPDLDADAGRTPCAAQLARRGAVAVATARLDGDPVVVAVGADGEAVVLDSRTCDTIGAG